MSWATLVVLSVGISCFIVIFFTACVTLLADRDTHHIVVPQ